MWLKKLFAFTDSEKVKSTVTAYILWLPPLGLLGVHRLYTGKLTGLVMLGIVALWLLLFTVFLVGQNVVDGLTGYDRITLGLGLDIFNAWIILPIAGVLGLWWLVDGFFMNDTIKKYNQELFNRLNDSSPIHQTNRSTNNQGNGKLLSTRMAYILWLPPLGLFGAHRLYTGQMRTGLTMLIISTAGLIPSLYSIIRLSVDFSWNEGFLWLLAHLFGGAFGYALVIAIGFWWLVDGFWLREEIKKRNAEMLEDISGDSPPVQP